MRKSLLTSAALALSLSLSLSACGGDASDSSASGGGGATVTESKDDSKDKPEGLPTELDCPRGIEIDITNIYDENGAEYNPRGCSFNGSSNLNGFGRSYNGVTLSLELADLMGPVGKSFDEAIELGEFDSTSVNKVQADNWDYGLYTDSRVELSVLDEKNKRQLKCEWKLPSGMKGRMIPFFYPDEARGIVSDEVQKVYDENVIAPEFAGMEPDRKEGMIAANADGVSIAPMVDFHPFVLEACDAMRDKVM